MCMSYKATIKYTKLKRTLYEHVNCVTHRYTLTLNIIKYYEYIGILKHFESCDRKRVRYFVNWRDS